MAKLRGLFNKNTIVFPSMLMNTAISGELLSINKSFKYALNIVNMIPDTGAAGRGMKRFGTKPFAAAIPSGNIIQLFRFITEAGDLQLLAYSDEGNIYHLNGATWDLAKSGLATDVQPRSVDFNEKLIIFNGVDNNMSWDGSTIEELKEFVEDNFTDGLWVSDNVMTFKPFQGADHKYNTVDEVKIDFESGGVFTTVQATPTGVSYDSGTGVLTLTFAAGTLPASSETVDTIRYTDRAPAFAYVFTQHSRMWALVGGDLRVYYTEFTNNENGWFNQTTQTVPSILMENTHPTNDEFVGIQAIEGQMLFHGKRATQIWSGFTPTAEGDFSFSKTIPVGCVDGNLLRHFPQDIVIATEYGIRSFKNAATTENLEASPDIGSAIDPTIQSEITNLLLDDTKMRDVRSFSYTRDGMYGFKLDEYILIYILSEKTKGWVSFTGAFTTSRAFLEYGNELLLTKDDTVLVYANGADGSAPVYDDDGDAYQTIWSTPALEPTGRYANRKIELILQTDIPTSTVFVRRYMDNNRNSFYDREIVVNTLRSDWDADFWDDAFWDFSKDTRPILKDKYIANAISYEIKTNHTEPFGLAGFNLIGG